MYKLFIVISGQSLHLKENKNLLQAISSIPTSKSLVQKFSKDRAKS